jgi:hypothetical protein
MTAHVPAFLFAALVANDTGKYIKVTRYWSYRTDVSWHTDAVQHCLSPNTRYAKGDIEYENRGAGPQVKVRGEVTDGADCSGRVVAELWSATCDLRTSVLDSPISENWGEISLSRTNVVDPPTYAWGQFNNSKPFDAQPCR